MSALSAPAHTPACVCLCVCVRVRLCVGDVSANRLKRPSRVGTMQVDGARAAAH